MKDKKTVGQKASELLLRPDHKQGIIDTQKEMNKKFLPEVEQCIKNHKHLTEPYYIVVINKRERLMINAIRQYFVARQTLPTPDYDQTCFKYTPSCGDLELLWVVPDRDSLHAILLNANMLPVEQSELLKFCRLFQQGKLDEVCGK
jgi:hypothetical protein